MNKLTDLAEKLGYSYLYHYNPYVKKWVVFSRDTHRGYFNGFRNRDGKETFPQQIAKGNTIEEAIEKMLAKIDAEKEKVSS